MLRTFWLVLGPVTLLALAVITTQQEGYSTIDVWFAGGVALVILARLVDVTRYSGTTAAGEPVTIGPFAVHGLRVVVTASGGWLVAHALQAEL